MPASNAYPLPFQFIAHSTVLGFFWFDVVFCFCCCHCLLLLLLFWGVLCLFLGARGVAQMSSGDILGHVMLRIARSSLEVAGAQSECPVNAPPSRILST